MRLPLAKENIYSHIKGSDYGAIEHYAYGSPLERVLLEVILSDHFAHAYE
jgi:hypothetical protein